MKYGRLPVEGQDMTLEPAQSDEMATSDGAKPVAVPHLGTSPTPLLQRIDHLSPAELYVMGLAPSSRRTMSFVLERIARLLSDGAHSATTFPWHLATHQQAVALRTWMLEAGYAASSINVALSAWRGAVRAAWRAGAMDVEARERACDIRGVRHDPEPTGRALDLAEIAGLLQACDEDVARPVASARDAAVLALAYGSGLRRFELVGAKVEGLDLHAGTLAVLGKGARRRIAHLQPEVIERLTIWLEHRGRRPGALFLPVTRSQRIGDRHLSPATIGDILARRVEQAGLSRATSHDLRRSCVSALLDADVELAMVAQLVGHRDVRTTARYDRRTEQKRHLAAQRLTMPG